MRIGFDIGPVTDAPTGVGRYAYQLLRHLVALDSGVAYRGFSVGTRAPALRELEAAVPSRHVRVPARMMYGIWNVLGAPRVDRLLGGVDVYHATNFYLPPTGSAKTVLTIHDLAFLAHPEWCSPKIVGVFTATVRRAAHRADAILACSESGKQDIVRLLEVPPEKVTAALEGVDETLAPVERGRAAAELERRYRIATPFLLFVSTLEPRKNVAGLVRAFAQVAAEIPHSLVLAGPIGWNAEPILEAIEDAGLGPRIVRPGYVPDSDLSLFYSAADAFVFPSRYEGFGLSVLEAMACGCPVITSNSSSLPEIAGDAAVYVDPDNEAGIATAVRDLVSDDDLRRRLSEQGLERAKQFSWTACAETVLGVYRRLAAC